MGKHTDQIDIQAPADKVWGVITNGERLSDWLSPVSNVEGIEPAGPLAAGSKLEVTIGKIGGAKLNIKEAQRGRTLRWNAGPAMAHMMRMPMKIELDLQPRGETTTATITFKTNPMIAPLMKMMTGLNFKEEAPNTVQKLKAAVESA